MAVLPGIEVADALSVGVMTPLVCCSAWLPRELGNFSAMSELHPGVLPSPSTSRTSTQHRGNIPEKTRASRVWPLTLVKPASSDGGATRYPRYQAPSFPPCSIMYNSSPISRGRSAGDEGWKGYTQIAKAILGRGLQPGMSHTQPDCAMLDRVGAKSLRVEDVEGVSQVDSRCVAGCLRRVAHLHEGRP